MDSGNSTQEIAIQLGLNLRQTRIETGLTQALLAARAGVSTRVISRMEQGDSTVSLSRWLKASKALKLLDSWDKVLETPEDPFTQYDREQIRKTDPGKRRVRSGKKK